MLQDLLPQVRQPKPTPLDCAAFLSSSFALLVSGAGSLACPLTRSASFADLAQRCIPLPRPSWRQARLCEPCCSVQGVATRPAKAGALTGIFWHCDQTWAVAAGALDGAPVLLTTFSPRHAHPSASRPRPCPTSTNRVSDWFSPNETGPPWERAGETACPASSSTFAPKPRPPSTSSFQDGASVRSKGHCGYRAKEEWLLGRRKD